MTALLEGLRVIELGTSVAAPYATLILAAMGAEVIKVERPVSGDVARRWGRSYHGDTSLWFHSLNANKKSIAVDLKNEAEVSTLREFITSEIDVVIQNLRPGRVEEMGLDADRLCAASEKLIYCNLGAFGNTGPLQHRPGYDPLMQAFGGPMSVTGEAGQAPVRTGCSIVDVGTGIWSTLGIVALVNRRHSTGKGGVVDTALYETSLAWMSILMSEPLNGGPTPERYGSGISGIVPYQAYQCSDGWLMVGGGTDAIFERLCTVLGHSEWVADERFRGNPERVRHRDQLNALLEPVFYAKPRAHWQRILDEAGVPNAPMQNAAEAMNHPQTDALGIIHELEDGLRLLGLPISIDGERPALTEKAPAVGEHTDLLLGPYR